jgi:hypothetical protein
MGDNFRERLLRGERLVGTIISLPASELAEGYTLICSGIDIAFYAKAALETVRALKSPLA